MVKKTFFHSITNRLRMVRRFDITHSQKHPFFFFFPIVNFTPKKKISPIEKKKFFQEFFFFPCFAQGKPPARSVYPRKKISHSKIFPPPILPGGNPLPPLLPQEIFFPIVKKKISQEFFFPPLFCPGEILCPPCLPQEIFFPIVNFFFTMVP